MGEGPGQVGALRSIPSLICYCLVNPDALDPKAEVGSAGAFRQGTWQEGTAVVAREKCCSLLLFCQNPAICREG